MPMNSRPIYTQFAQFMCVGSAGFALDAGTTLLLVQTGVPPWLARSMAIALAMVFTWLLNGRFTFARGDPAAVSTFLPYLLVALAAAGLNYSVFLLVLGPLGSILFAVALATAVSMSLSFAGYKWLVFRA